MGFYDKNIQYLDLWEYGEKTGNVGFIKIEVRDKQCKVWISLKNIFPSEVLISQLYLLIDNEEVLADQIILHQGMANYASKWNADKLAGKEIGYEKWCGIKIVLSEHRYVEKRWNVSAIREEKKIEPPQDKEQQRREQNLTKEVKTPSEKNGIKWSKIESYYKKKKTSEDGEECLCISLEDLILLPEKYEHLFINSFLLHGYYAYGYLLLGRMSVVGRYTYKLYVPGLGHGKERVVAKMFGFEGFVSATDSDQEGFGYYFMPVEI